MNKQNKGNGSRGIEWTDYTWNPVGGCQHGCKWEMPDGQIAQCYAKSVAEGVAMAAYPQGFEQHYFKPALLNEPLKLKTPSRIFLDSMSDLMGHWVPDAEIEKVLDICRQADWHQFQLLTKNPARLLKFADKFPLNVWIGVSLPPTYMWGKRLSPAIQQRMFIKTLNTLYDLRNGIGNVTWLSLEPLSFDAAVVMHLYDYKCTDWIVIGAASHGKKTFQPNPEHVRNVLRFADARQIAVFFKGNLDWSPRREEMPKVWTVVK